MGGGDFLITVGRILRPHGLRGDVKVDPSTDWPDRFAELRTLCVVMPVRPGKWIKIEQVRIQQGDVILKLSGFENRSQADTLRGAELCTRENELPFLPEGHYYIHDLVGMNVKTVPGEKIGSVVDVIQMPAQDIYIVDVHGREAMIPAVKEFVKRIDLQKKEIIIDPIEGLIDSDED
jgi:16S rRNA processing protein RimM